MILLILIAISHSVALQPDDKTIYTYYDEQYRSSKWLPFNLNCSDCIYNDCHGNQCHNIYGTDIYKSSNNPIQCNIQCPRTNINKVQTISQFTNGYPLLVSNFYEGLTCWYEPSNKTIKGITTTIWYDYYYYPYIIGKDSVHLINCSITANYTANVWTESLVIARRHTIHLKMNTFEIVLICIICSCIVLVCCLFILATSILTIQTKIKRNQVEYIGNEAELDQSQ